MSDHLSKEAAEIIGALMQEGWRIRVVDHGGYDGCDFILTGPQRELSHETVMQLSASGWLKCMASGMAYKISDKGIGSYHHAIEFGVGGLPVRP